MVSFDALVERCNAGEPIIAPTHLWWETGVTFNAATVYLERSAANDKIIQQLLPGLAPDDPRLADGVVAVHYRARPEHDPGSAFARSFIGLAVFTPDLQLLDRRAEPVISPEAGQGFDTCGVEDPRITRLGDTFYMVYCGVAYAPDGWNPVRLCLATSDDLVHWRKHGPLIGDPAEDDNKDGVLFPETIDGRYYLLHRPMGSHLPQSELTIHLAVADAPAGPWCDLGEILRAEENPLARASWLGAGSVPIPLGDRRYLVIYHTGNYLKVGDREYDLDAAIFDFARLDPADPAAIVTSRLEHLMTPQSPAELRSRSQLQVANVLFACGSYEYRDQVYIIYGGADTYTLAARVPRDLLVEAVETNGEAVLDWEEEPLRLAA